MHLTNAHTSITIPTKGHISKAHIWLVNNYSARPKRTDKDLLKYNSLNKKRLFWKDHKSVPMRDQGREIDCTDQAVQQHQDVHQQQHQEDVLLQDLMEAGNPTSPQYSPTSPQYNPTSPQSPQMSWRRRRRFRQPSFSATNCLTPWMKRLGMVCRIWETTCSTKNHTSSAC